MATQLSFEQEDQSNQISGERASSDEGGARVFGRFAGVIDHLWVSALHAIEGIKRAQARGGKRKQMRLVESLALGNRRQILLVACDNQRYLVGVGPDSVGSILAMGPGTGSRERSARGPELVRRRGREASLEAKSNPNLSARSKEMAEAGLELWQ